jgi:hypothetical protein
MRVCEKCQAPAEVYAMGRGSGDWGGFYCEPHTPSGFIITDRYIYTNKEQA